MDTLLCRGLLFLSIVLCQFQAIGKNGDQDSLIVFENYATCLKGLKDTTGQEVVPAIYSRLFPLDVQIAENLHRYWYFADEEEQGFMETSGEKVMRFPINIRLDFTGVSYREKLINQVILTEEGDRQGAISWASGKPETRYFDEVYFREEWEIVSVHRMDRHQFIYRSGKKWGVMNWKFEDVLPPTDKHIVEFFQDRYFIYRPKEKTSKRGKRKRKWSDYMARGVVNNKGEVVVKAGGEYLTLLELEDGSVRFWHYDELLKVYDEQQNLVNSFTYQGIGEGFLWHNLNIYGPFITMVNNEEKYGMVKRSGETVFPFIYDYPFQSMPFKPKGANGRWHCLTYKDERWILMYEDGEEIMSMQGQQYKDYDKQWWVYNDSMSTAYNLRLEVLIDSCQSLTNGEERDRKGNLVYRPRDYYGQRGRPKSATYAKRNGYLYVCNRGDSVFYLCDSTRFDFDSELFFFTIPSGTLVNKTGKVIYSHHRRLDKVGNNYYFADRAGMGKVDGHTGKLSELKHNFQNVVNSGTSAFVTTREGRVGTFDLKTHTWETDTNYFAIGESVFVGSNHGRWVKTTPFKQDGNCCYKEQGWKVVNDSGAVLLPGEYDFPFQLYQGYHQRYAIYSAGGKMGLMNRDGSIYRQPDHTRYFFSPKRNGQIIVYDGEWGVITTHGKSLPPEWDGLIPAYTKYILAWKGSGDNKRFTMFDAELNIIFGDLPADSIVFQRDLHYDFGHKGNGYGFRGAKDNRVVNNWLTLRMELNKAINNPNDAMFMNGPLMAISQAPCHYYCEDKEEYDVKHYEIGLSWLGKKFFSIAETEGEGYRNGLGGRDQIQKLTSHRSYRYTENEIVEVTLNDIISDKQRLYDLIFQKVVDHLNKLQNRHIACSNLDALSQDITETFSLSGSGITFHLDKDIRRQINMQSMLVTWEELNGLLRTKVE